MTAGTSPFQRTRVRAAKILESLDCLEEAIEHELLQLNPDQLFRLDDQLQAVRRKATAAADMFRQYVIKFHLEQRSEARGNPIIERPEELRNEMMQVPAQFVLRQVFKTRVRNEAKVVEKLLHWAGGDPIAVFHSGESGALRANPWRTSLIEEACGRTYLLKEPDGEPKVVAISEYQAQRKEN